MLPPSIKSLILDMDGVLWKDEASIGDLPAIFDCIYSRGLKVAFATNNGTRTPEQYVERLTGFGVKIEPWQVVTSSLGVAHLLGKRFPSGGPIFAIGEEGLMEALREKQFVPLSEEDTTDAQAVVIGFDHKVNFLKLSNAALLVSRGLPFYATNSDRTFPTPQGEIPGAGAWISVVITATGLVPIYAGKPAPYLLDLACERLGTKMNETLIVGDRLETDIAGGQQSGYPVALVLSGVSTRQQYAVWKHPIDFIADDLHSLIL
jgi:4-nitrophenyl phosphatase